MIFFNEKKTFFRKFSKKCFFIFKICFFRWKKKLRKKIGSLYRCRILSGIYFSHPWSDLTTISSKSWCFQIRDFEITDIFDFRYFWDQIFRIRFFDFYHGKCHDEFIIMIVPFYDLGDLATLQFSGEKVQ